MSDDDSENAVYVLKTDFSLSADGSYDLRCHDESSRRNAWFKVRSNAVHFKQPGFYTIQVTLYPLAADSAAVLGGFNPIIVNRRNYSVCHGGGVKSVLATYCSSGAQQTDTLTFSNGPPCRYVNRHDEVSFSCPISNAAAPSITSATFRGLIQISRLENPRYIASSQQALL